MARGRKKLTLDEQLAKTLTDIDNTEKLLKELKTTKKDLEEQIHQARLSELDKLIQNHGLSLDDIKDMLTSRG